MPIRSLLAASLAVSSVPALAQGTGAAPLLDTATGLRCSAAFGIGAGQQARGEANAARWPALAGRGREFFVQIGARLMDEEKLDRPAMQVRFKGEVDRLQAELASAADAAAAMNAVMTPCLALLDASVPAK